MYLYSSANIVLFSQITIDLCKNQPKVCSFHLFVYSCPRQRAILRQAKRQGDYLRPFGSKRAELERKQAGGSESSALTIRISRQNTEIRRFPNRNLENCVISQTSDKQRWFEISSKVTKKREKCKFGEAKLHKKG